MLTQSDFFDDFDTEVSAEEFYKGGDSHEESCGHDASEICSDCQCPVANCECDEDAIETCDPNHCLYCQNHVLDCECGDRHPDYDEFNLWDGC